MPFPLAAAAILAAMMVVVGSLNMDLVGQAPRIPAPGETVLGGELARFHGGKGGNQATAAARLGARVAFVGAVGNDADGREMCESLADEGVDVTGIARTRGASGAALITVTASGENAITVLPGANRAAPLPTGPWPAAAHVLLLQLEVPMPVNLAWARLARDAGATVMLNAAPFAPLPPSLLGCVDLLVVNRAELTALTGEASTTLGLRAIAVMGVRRVIATLGAAGCAALADGRAHSVPACRVDVVDSTGAGDTFAGALAAAWLRGENFDAVMRYANAAAALACTQMGARAGMPCAGDVEQLLARS